MAVQRGEEDLPVLGRRARQGRPRDVLGHRHRGRSEHLHLRRQHPLDARRGAPGRAGPYAQKKTIWIEPRTGAIVKQTQDETRTQANGDPLLSLNIVYTPQTIKTAVDDASSKADSLNLLTNWIPIIGLVGGLILVILGLALVLGGRRRGGEHVAKGA